MRRYITQHNIAHFRNLLNTEIDEHKRNTLEQLIAEAESELRRLTSLWKWTCPHIDIAESVGRSAEKLLERAVAHEGAWYGCLQFWDHSTNRLYLVAQCNFGCEFAERFAEVNADDSSDSIRAAALASRSSVVIDDIDNAEGFTALREWARAANIRAIRTTPIFRDASVTGFYSTHFLDSQAFNPALRNESKERANQFAKLFTTINCRLT